MKTFNVIAGDIITKAGIEPFVGLTVVVNGKQEQIARTCKQTLLDLHKSARAGNIPSGLFDNGYASANPLMVNAFREAVIGLVNKTGIADVEFYEAGSDYEATEFSTAVKEGTAKVGDILQTEKKGSRIEGFMNFPLTDLELAQKAFLSSANPLVIMQGLFGITMPNAVQAPVVEQRQGIEQASGMIPDPIHAEAFGEVETPETITAEVIETKTKATAK